MSADDKVIMKSVTAAGKHKGRMVIALCLTATFMAVEVIGGILTGSLALLADAAHMMTDAGGLTLALIAIRFSERPATPRLTFGYARAEILSAVTNAVVLLLVTVYILYEAYQRFKSPPEILSGPMLIVAAAGLLVNLGSMALLSSGANESLNVKGAYFEVLSDMLGSLGVILAALVVMATGWTLADPVIAAGIGLFIVPRTWILLKQAVNILMEGTPSEIDMTLLERELLSITGVLRVHDLHVWTVTSGMDSMSGHLVTDSEADPGSTLVATQKVLKEKFGLEHTTIQLEAVDLKAREGTQGI